MFVVLLGQVAEGGLPPAVVIALILVAAASALALFVCIRIARRMRAIGEAGDRGEEPGARGQGPRNEDTAP